MNDKDRDRSGDGAGPVAQREKTINPPGGALRRGFVWSLLLSLSLVLVPETGRCDKGEGAGLRGLSLTVDAGMIKASSFHADFYSGRPGNVNTLERIIHSEAYGHSIWNNLTNQDLIGSSVASYKELTVAEYGDMYYRLAFQLGIGFRYDFYGSDFGWLVRFDYAKLHALGMVLLNSGHAAAYLTNQNAYVRCPVAGLEERIYVDLGLLRKVKLGGGLDLEIALGGNVNNTRVESSDIEIGGVGYSILDIWGGQSPSSYVGSYEYVNQGGIGYGGFATVSVGFTLPTGTGLSVGYTLHYNKVNLQGYDTFAFHHAFGLNVALNDFSFFD